MRSSFAITLFDTRSFPQSLRNTLLFKELLLVLVSYFAFVLASSNCAFVSSLKSDPQQLQQSLYIELKVTKNTIRQGIQRTIQKTDWDYI